VEWGKVGEKCGACLGSLIDTFDGHLVNQKDDDDELSKRDGETKTKKSKRKREGTNKLRPSELKDKKKLPR
jgi:hypothetical protein